MGEYASGCFGSWQGCRSSTAAVAAQGGYYHHRPVPTFGWRSPLYERSVVVCICICIYAFALFPYCHVAVLAGQRYRLFEGAHDACALNKQNCVKSPIKIFISYQEQRPPPHSASSGSPIVLEYGVDVFKIYPCHVRAPFMPRTAGARSSRSLEQQKQQVE